MLANSMAQKCVTYKSFQQKYSKQTTTGVLFLAECFWCDSLNGCGQFEMENRQQNQS